MTDKKQELIELVAKVITEDMFDVKYKDTTNEQKLGMQGVAGKVIDLLDIEVTGNDSPALHDDVLEFKCYGSSKVLYGKPEDEMHEVIKVVQRNGKPVVNIEITKEKGGE